MRTTYRTQTHTDFNYSAHALNHSRPVAWSNVEGGKQDAVTRLVEEAIAIRKTKGTFHRDSGNLLPEMTIYFEPLSHQF